MSTVYVPGTEMTWTGRIDSKTDYDAYRWHQWIEPIDLSGDLPALEAETLGFALLGFCSDEGVKRNKGRGGAKKGPASIRKELANKPCRFDQAVRLYDAGDIRCTDGELERAQTELEEAVEKLLNMGLFPIVLGGGHEVALGHYAGISNVMQRDDEKLGIINFDAHFDLRPVQEHGSSGTMFRQIADRCVSEDRHFGYFCLGIQENANTVALFRSAKALGVEYILAKEMASRDEWALVEKLDVFMRSHDALYVTICSDVIASAFAPGVSAAQPLGVMPEQALRWLKYILRTGKVVSFDIAEVSPRFDQDNTTANLAAVMVFSVVRTLSQLNGYGISI